MEIVKDEIESTPVTKTEVTANKNYRWEPTDSVTITGLEFDVLQKTLSLLEGCQLGELVMKPAFKVRTEIFERMVKAGIAKEYTPEPTPNTTDEVANAPGA